MCGPIFFCLKDPSANMSRAIWTLHARFVAPIIYPNPALNCGGLRQRPELGQAIRRTIQVSKEWRLRPIRAYRSSSPLLPRGTKIQTMLSTCHFSYSERKHRFRTLIYSPILLPIFSHELWQARNYITLY